MQSNTKTEVGHVSLATHDQDFTVDAYCSDSFYNNSLTKVVGQGTALVSEFNDTRSDSDVDARAYARNALLGPSSWSHGKLIKVNMVAGDNEQHSLTSSVITDRLTCAARASNK